MIRAKVEFDGKAFMVDHDMVSKFIKRHEMVKEMLKIQEAFNATSGIERAALGMELNHRMKKMKNLRIRKLCCTLA